MNKFASFPDIIFIRVEDDTDGSQYLLPSITKTAALDGLNRVRIGVYKFVETQEIQPSLPLWKRVRTRKTK